MSENTTLENMERLLQRLAVNNSQLRADNRRLRQLVVNRGRGRILARALDDATAMLAWRFAGYAITRDSCHELGLPERRWEWARALLMTARIHDGDDITEPQFDVAIRQLAAAHDRIDAQGDIGALIIRRRKRETMRPTTKATRPGTRPGRQATAQAAD